MIKNNGTEEIFEDKNKQNTRSFGFIFLFILIGCLFIGGTIFHIDQYGKVLRINNEIQLLEKQLEAIKAKRKNLELQKSELSNFEAIYDTARENGMIYPKGSNLYWLQITGEERNQK
ncbi:MAG: hypothetical protein A2161_12885 [Candidatus Schekmanbacteria bacterium RBG_13_48_7]|uniref:Cell division protein FtsL n=1 Tax=Candidatus Schekmanbacteria bacterium RBG_13_48_7 TaxID=1817878 RepID=A0A1F7RUU6_9BACT|nr:MAG: hypothetical protein A2161_12885 [Candidatus Schekmanbacteria bacterium RBG_13_48_7]